MAADGERPNVAGWIRFRRGMLVPAVCVALVGLFGSSEAAAHGFHNAALVTSSLDEWLADVKAVIPQFDQRMLTSQSGPGSAGQQPASQAGTGTDARKPALPPGRLAGKIETQLAPAQRELLNRKASDCLEVLAYLAPRNIIPEEFPNFELSKVADYRQAAKQLLKLMGPQGTSAVIGRIENELMAPRPPSIDMTPHPEYHDDLLEVLESAAQAGNLRGRDVQALLEASQGRKSTSAQTDLAAKVQEAFIERADLPTFLRTVAGVGHTRLRKQLLAKADEKIDAASLLELLQASRASGDSHLQRKIAAELKTRSPKYAEVRDQLAELWRLAGSSETEVADDARKHVADAFQRAPISECLRWIGEGDQRLSDLIWEQIDGRIERADADRRAGYRDVALAVLGHDPSDPPGQAAALKLLARLGDARAVRPLVELLPKMPRELWPQTGGTLRELTGQDLGPHGGDGPVEVLAAIERWRAWLKENGEP